MDHHKASMQKHEIKTLDHLIFQCKRLNNGREILKGNVLKVGKWPVSKSELIGI